MRSNRASFIFWGGLLLGALMWEQGCSKLGDFVDPAQPAPSPSPQVPNPIHAWGFEGNGQDEGSVGGWNGALSGAASYTSIPSQVKIGNEALSLTGTNGDSLMLSSVTIPAQMTFSCWVQWAQGVVSSNAIFANSVSGAAQNGFRFYVIESTGQLVFETSDGSTQVQTTSITNLPTTPAYTHVAVTVDSVNNLAAIYVNGSLSSSSGVTQPNFNLTGGTFIGAMSLSTAPFDGDIDDCELFDQLLSSAQIQLLYSGSQ